MIDRKKFYFPSGLILSAVALISSPVVSAAPVYESVFENQRFLESRVTELVRLVDPKALALVDLVVPKEKKELPGVPFYFEDYMISGADRLRVERVEINVVTGLTALPESITDLIKESVAPLTSRVKITLRPFQSASPAPEVKHSEKTPEFAWSDVLIDRRWLNGAALVGIASFVVFGLGLLFFLATLGQRAGRISNSLSSELDNRREPGPAPTIVRERTSSPSPANSPSPGTDETALVAELPLASGLALLSDCYWCEQDGYAAFLWKCLPVTKRMELLAAWPVLEKYVRTFQTVPAVDFGFHRDVSYLNPISLERFNNGALSDLVKKHPAFLFRLSPMRSGSLSLSLSERADLMRRAQAPSALFDLTKVAGSAPRALEDRTRVRIGSEKQETEALALKDFSVTLKEQFVTLAWIVQLPKEQVHSILEEFNARELATAWIGPERLLSFLAECLPDKKRALVESYRATLTPSRDSESYLRLHARTISALKKGLSPSSDPTENSRAA